MPIWLILAACAGYLAVLFVIAHRGERAPAAARPHPLVFALALGVYCTSWTYFGAVGAAASSGWDYLPIYLGPALVFLFAPGFLRRIGDVAKRESITSLSDFLSARYGKSRAVAGLATVLAVLGSLPYIALQLKSVGASFQVLAGGAGADRPSQGVMLATALAMAAMAIVFGARRSDTTRQNPGLMRLLAVEAVVKLGALAAVCAAAVWALGGPVAGGGAAPAPAPSQPFLAESLSGRFFTITLLSMAAIVCLPRQFHIAVIERRAAREISFARFAFPLYLALTSAVVIPITLAGLRFLSPAAPADLYVLELPLAMGQPVLALLVFLGGFSAATGMVLVSSIALSTMVTNDLLVPAAMRSGWFQRLSGQAGARLLAMRRTVIAAIMLLAFAYSAGAAGGEALAQIGLVSFAAAAQFAPALIAGLYWRGAHRTGVLAGLGAGLGLWLYTLFLPALIGVEAMRALTPAWLDPHALLGWTLADPLTHGAVWSLGANCVSLALVSLRTPERLRDRVQAAAFVEEAVQPAPSSLLGSRLSGPSPQELKALAARFLTTEAVESAFAQIGAETGMRISGDAPADWGLVQRTERLLARALGASSARVVLSSALAQGSVSLGDVLAILDHKAEAARFDRHMLQAMLENIPVGVSVVDAEQRLVAWNAAYVQLFDYPLELVQVGQPVARLIEHNIRAGWIEGDPALEAERRIGHMRAGRPHRYERQIPSGRHVRILGHPMPGGGYVSTFADITEDKHREAQLIAAKAELEARVRERTRALENLTAALDAARREAEGANASKTRFLAAASHDLMQPLNAARLFLGAVERSEANHDLLSKADRAIEAADELLRGLLDISRLDHAETAARPVVLPIGPLMEDLTDEAAPIAGRAGLRLRCAPSPLMVRADPEFLKSILRNFLSNAIRYTSAGGVLIGARRRGGCVRLEVWDTGPGIAPENLERLFEEFLRLHDRDNAGKRGAGLGLSVAKRLAGLMGARIEVRSRPGKGSVFAVEVALGAVERAPAPRAARHRPAAPSPAPLGLRVLCLDDEGAILEAMRALLQRWGCEAACASSLEEAAALAHTGRLDAAVADLRLEGVDSGLALLQALRATQGPTLRLALLTASLTPEAAAQAAAINAVILRKPIDPAQLRRFLAQAESAPQSVAEGSSVVAAL